MKTWKDGLARLGAHIVGWALGVYFVAYLLERADASVRSELIVRGLICILIILRTAVVEMQEYSDWRQTKGKTIIDLLAKTGGVVIAFFTVGWWREL